MVEDTGREPLAVGTLTHGAPVDGLLFVFLLGSVPHKWQLFQCCRGIREDKEEVERNETHRRRDGGEERREKTY